MLFSSCFSTFKRCVGAASLGCMALFSSAAQAGGVTPWLDFSLHNGHISIPIAVSGVPSHAILDSGAQINGINEAFLQEHSLDYPRLGKVRIEGVFKKQERDTLSNIPVTMFGNETDFDDVVEVSLGHHSVGMLLGAPLFYGRILQIDYPSKRLRVVTRDAMELRDFTNIAMFSKRNSGMPLVEVSLNGHDVWLMLDTGSSGGIMIERSLAAELDLLKDDNAIEEVSGVNSKATVESTRASEVGFGPYTLENVLVTFSTEDFNTSFNSKVHTTGSRIRSRRVAGLIGYDVLKHFILTMDYGRGQMHVGLPKEGE